MKPVDFDYARPTTLAAAIDLLARGDGGARAVAGSQSLGPMLNLRLAQPDLLVDVTAIPELLGMHEETGRVVIGAGVTHARLEDGGGAGIDAGGAGRGGRRASPIAPCATAAPSAAA